MTRSVERDGLLAALGARQHPSSRERLVARESEGVVLLVADLPHPFRAAFTTRHGGVSRGVFASLNLSGDQGDDAAAVRDNHARLIAALTALDVDHRRPFQLVSPHQEHGLRVVGTAEHVREGARTPCDGLTLRAPLDDGLAALLLFADCVPVILVGDVDVAVVHAGWRGLVGGVVQQGARAMTGPPGAAFVGPSIGPCCFSVDEEVAHEFALRYGEEVVREGPRVDLWRATEQALAEVEVPAVRVVNPRLCTVCNSDLFFSYRKDGPLTGRQGAVAWMADPIDETGRREAGAMKDS